MLGNSDGQMMEMHVALFVAFGCSYKYTFSIGILYGLDVREDLYLSAVSMHLVYSTQ